MVEITQRTIQGRFLFRPAQRFNRILVGCLAKAQSTTAAHSPETVKLHAVAVLSNHLHVLASFETTQHMAAFMNHFKCNLSKEVGSLHDWPGPLYDGRYSAVAVSDEPAAQEARLRYILSQGVKDGLVLSPRDWPGVHCAEALLAGEPLCGLWVDRARLFAAQQKHRDAKELDFTTEAPVHLAPLPAWGHLPNETRQDLAAAMIDSIEIEGGARYKATGTTPLGATAVCQRYPHDRPTSVARSARPMFHAATRAVRQMLVEAYRVFEAAYRDAADRLAAVDRWVDFPENCFPPRLHFVVPAAA